MRGRLDRHRKSFELAKVSLADVTKHPKRRTTCARPPPRCGQPQPRLLNEARHSQAGAFTRRRGLGAACSRSSRPRRRCTWRFRRGDSRCPCHRRRRRPRRAPRRPLGREKGGRRLIASAPIKLVLPYGRHRLALKSSRRTHEQVLKNIGSWLANGRPKAAPLAVKDP